jgi:hypothetical protein
MTELTDLTGVEWGTPVEAVLNEWPYTIVFSTEFPYIELISSTPGSPWEVTDGPRFHHLGWWTDSLDTTACRWLTTGATPSYDGRTAGRSFAYFLAPSIGTNLEIVDNSRQSDFLKTWANNTPPMKAIHEK